MDEGTPSRGDPALDSLVEKYGENEVAVLDLRQRSKLEITATSQEDLVWGMVKLEQSLYKRQREIEKVCRVLIAKAEEQKNEDAELPQMTVNNLGWRFES